jgi:hypothetical protein
LTAPSLGVFAPLGIAGFDTGITKKAMKKPTKGTPESGLMQKKIGRRIVGSLMRQPGPREPAWRSPAMQTESAEVIERRIIELRTEHRDLDLAIESLTAHAVHDELQLKRLKKRKLMLKDQVNFLESQLTPDIPA